MTEAEMLARIAGLEARVAALESTRPAQVSAPSTSTSSGGGLVASDRDLDGPYGDPVVKKDPKRWTGASYAGCKMSECPSEYLMVLADLFDWMADQDDAQGKTWTSKKEGARPVPASKFKRSDAAKARGWANRNHGKQPTTPQDAGGDFSDPPPEDDGIPF